MTRDLIVIAGPCAVENEEQVLKIAKKLKKLKVNYLRGGAFKPRTNSSDFQGLGEEGLKILFKAKKETGIKIVTEILDYNHLSLFEKYNVDVYQVGSRNMQNFELLKNLAERAGEKTILLKRGFANTKKEVLGAISYLKKYGHSGDIWFCERGIRTFANGEYDRFTLDVAIIADLSKEKRFDYKIIVDPSHAAGRKDLVENLAMAGVAAGADGIMVEVKNEEKDCPLCDASQAMNLEIFKKTLNKCKNIFNIR
ncbi:3-deoxy-7-phosphoheptulonate synthase [archaeon]|jgi:3-deoxy-7-phosphoheptulonate synthase|nr:3-deoxy-7-phosphoheptulonate synthase [archaeon]